jgi:hypothetical protein
VASRKVLSRKRVANADSFKPTPSPVETGQLNEGAELIKRSGREEIWRGSINIDSIVDVPAYLRMGSLRTVVSELVCSVVGRALGLPIPRPYLVRVNKPALPASTAWNEDEAMRYTFACAEVSESTAFSQLISHKSEYARKLLRGWELYPHTVTFDEWVGNLDRNQSNILFSANVIWLIDHADALGGVLGEIHDLSDIQGDAFSNVLLDRHVADFSVNDKSTLIAIAGEIMAFAAQLDLNSALDCASLSTIGSLATVKKILAFLGTRLLNTVPFLCNRIGMPQIILEA